LNKVCYKVSLWENFGGKVNVTTYLTSIDIGAKRNPSIQNVASKWSTPLKSPSSRSLSHSWGTCSGYRWSGWSERTV